MVKIGNFSEDEFVSKAAKKRIICFCAGHFFLELCKKYEAYEFVSKILYVIDNDAQKTAVVIKGEKIPVIRTAQMGTEVKSCILLITSMKFAEEVIAQLDRLPLCDGMTVYFPEVFTADNSHINFDSSRKQKIPKTIHYCWFGKGGLPDGFHRNIETWKKCCPDYDIRRWDESNYDISKNAYMRQAYEAGKWSFVSDYARVDIINRYGGIYLDTDIEVLKSFDPLLQFDLFCGFESYRYVNFGLGFGAIKGNGMLEELLELYEDLEFCLTDGTLNLVPSPVYQTKILERHRFLKNGRTQLKDGIAVLSPEYLSPVSQYDYGCPTENSFSIHQYKASWLTKEQREEKNRLKGNYQYVMERMRRDQNPLSVIVPVYNGEKYLPRCLDSIISQTMRDMEIICVDDGSTDSSLEILQKYAGKDARIQVICKGNGGLVAARKTGAEAASGKYIGYVDSDDWIEPYMYERLYSYAVKYQADLVCSGYYREGSYVSEHYDNVPEGIYAADKMEFLREKAIFDLEKKDVGIRGPLWCKLFLAQKFREVQMRIPEDISIAEDKVCVLSFLLSCSRVYITREAFYHYMIHQESMAHAADSRYLLRVNAVYRFLRSLYADSAFTETMRLQAELYITELLYKGINSRLGFLNENLLWIDPGWMEKLPDHSRVLLYGAGALGRKYYRQIRHCENLHFAGCIDYGYRTMKEDLFEVRNPEEWKGLQFDVIVITLKNVPQAQKVRRRLLEAGIEQERIYHFEQKELFWRFAEADGLLDRTVLPEEIRSGGGDGSETGE